MSLKGGELIQGRAGYITERKCWAPSWNCSESTNQITELHVSILFSANKMAQNLQKMVRGKHLMLHLRTFLEIEGTLNFDAYSLGFA